ncbi:P-loop containing nucleoside triphosphate hydrolase protein [Lipomyces japonicus]|uniref:P-loop containing nucleoside triphosphate hydrolase protein n=1 Tax=Lipomyces japonicus TaxID=56871 RepID=UPI0034CEAF2D
MTKSEADSIYDEKSPLDGSSASLLSGKGYSAIDGLDDEFSGLSENDAEILRKQIHVPSVPASFFRLFRYADRTDKVYLAIGVTAAILEGLMKPLMGYVFGYATQNFTDFSPDGYMNYYNGSSSEGFSYSNAINHNATEFNNHTTFGFQEFQRTEFVRNVSRQSLYLALIGIVTAILAYIKSFIFIDRGEVLSARIREHYLAAILRQNIGYFDKLGNGEITSRISSDTVMVQDAMSEKISYVITHLTTFIGSVILAYTQSPILSSIVIGDVFLIILTSYIGSKKVTEYAEKAQEGYTVGGSVAEEAFSSIRNIQAFSIQDRMALAYETFLDISEKWSIKSGIAIALESGFTFLFAFGIDSLTFWNGTRIYSQGDITVGQLMTCLMSLFTGAFAFTIISPYLANISTGVAASSKIFATIDRVSAIDSLATDGQKLNHVNGHIEFKNVRFIYPSRPNVTVLNNFNLKIPAGKTVALVGASGSGKSTVVGLIERFYNPVSGSILLDDHDILSLNTRWLRQNVALVSQEPILFACSIMENIAFGLIGSKYEFASETEKKELIIDACKQANAWDFIQGLPEKLETNVGERGFLMSGGQKQRIAIARAIVSNPKILLLDEATSALDTKSEEVVQAALDVASKNRTTIVIAHRLSTIRDADLIVVMRYGEIVEQGTHKELLEKKSDYYNLVQAQSIQALQHESYSIIEKNEEEYFDGTSGIELTTTRLTNINTSRSFVHVENDRDDKNLGSTESITTVLKFIFKLGKPELTMTSFGFLFGAFTGFGYLSLAVVYGVMLQGYQDYGMPGFGDQLMKTVYPMAITLFGHGCFLLITNSIAGSMFGTASSKLARRIRSISFRHFLRQDITYYDNEDNSVGSLTNNLSLDAQSIETIGGATTNKLVESVIIVYGGLIMCVAVGYKLGLVMFVSVPCVMLVGFFRFRFLTNLLEQSKKDNKLISSYACEITSSIRTVLSLTREQEILETYHNTLKRVIENNRLASVKSALFDGLSRGMQFFIMALGFFYGGLLMSQNEYSLFRFFIIFMIIVFGSETSTTVFSFAPEMGKAIQAGRNIKKLLESVPEIDSWANDGDVIPEHEINGNIEFRNVHFRYPTRQEVPVLQGLNLKINKGQFVALVGSSGCGKSTTIGLIESFYRPQRGSVLFDDRDISTLNVTKYRANIALVQQEPVLYSGSIKYNVSLGSIHPVSDDDVIEVCKQANIHDFITSLPDGYDTLCGTKGTLLSGGQKQRIAIARALIRNPKVLLLDEATSALDSESERIVQATLDQAAKGRTTIAVAHRLSTIQNADVIYVFENGKVLEQGTHQQLLASKGKYFDLVQLQALET